MSSAKGSGKRRGRDSESLRSEKKKKKRVEVDDLDADPDLSRYDLDLFASVFDFLRSISGFSIEFGAIVGEFQ